MTSVAVASTSARTRRARSRPPPLAVVGVRVDLGGGHVKRRPGRVQRDVDGAEMGQGVRADVTLGRGGQQRLGRRPAPRRTSRRPRPRRRARSPAGRCSCRARRPARPGYRRSRRRACRWRPCRWPARCPGPGERSRVLTANSRLPSGAVAVTSASVQDRAPGAVLLDAVEPPAPAGPAGRQPGPGRLRGPDSPAASGRRRRRRRARPGWPAASACPSASRARERSSSGQIGEDGPALPGPAAAGQRQVQPARLDRGGEGRRDRFRARCAVRAACGLVIRGVGEQPGPAANGF